MADSAEPAQASPAAAQYRPCSGPTPVHGRIPVHLKKKGVESLTGGVHSSAPTGSSSTVPNSRARHGKNGRRILPCNQAIKAIKRRALASYKTPYLSSLVCPSQQSSRASGLLGNDLGAPPPAAGNPTFSGEPRHRPVLSSLPFFISSPCASS